MACSTSFPHLVIDAKLKQRDLPTGPAYWEPSGAGPCAAVAADRCLPGVADWLDRAGLDSVYRLVPWYPFGGSCGNCFDRRTDLLVAVRAGNHIPIVRVDPARPESVMLAVALMSPVLDAPDGPDFTYCGPREMWHESIVPVGHGGCAASIAVGGEPRGLPSADRVVWVYPRLGMTEEPMAADMAILGELEHCFTKLPDRALQAKVEDGIVRTSALRMEAILTSLLCPFVTEGMGIQMPPNLLNSPWPVSALHGLDDLTNTNGQNRLSEADIREHVVAEMEKLRDSLRSTALPELVHSKFVSSGLRAESAEPPLSVTPDLASLRGALRTAAEGTFDRPSEEWSRRDPGGRMPALLPGRLDSVFSRMHSYLAVLFGIKSSYESGQPAKWRFGQSTMHFARRFGLLVDPIEAWDDGECGTAGVPEDILPLATDVAGRPVAFAKRIGKGFAVVVPDEDTFGDDRVRELVDHVSGEWSSGGGEIHSVSNTERPPADLDHSAPSHGSSGQIELERSPTDGEDGDTAWPEETEERPCCRLADLSLAITTRGLVFRGKSESGRVAIARISWGDDVLSCPHGSSTASLDKGTKQLELLKAMANGNDGSRRAQNSDDDMERGLTAADLREMLGMEADNKEQAFQRRVDRLRAILPRIVKPYVCPEQIRELLEAPARTDGCSRRAKAAGSEEERALDCLCDELLPLLWQGKEHQHYELWTGIKDGP